MGPVGPQGEPGENATWNLETSEAENCEFGGVKVTFTDAQDEGASEFEICNGATGSTGATGKAGKTTIVHADGTVEEIDTLPSTGSSGNDWQLALAGLGILALGGGTLWVLRRQG